MQSQTLDAFLDAHVARSADAAPIAAVVRRLADAAVELRDAINQGALGKAFAGARSEGGGGDVQKDLDVLADDVFLSAARGAPVALYASEELENPVLLDKAAPLALAIDPLDGSSNIDTNVSIGTIFSLLPVSGSPETDPMASFMQPGRMQRAAGFFVYGPQLALVLTLGAGTSIFVFSSRLRAFVCAYPDVQIAPTTAEFAINASNYRHWDSPVRGYIDACLEGEQGAHAQNYNMRWIASMVADAYRIFVRSGVFIYPGDGRKGYGKGRLRLIYEANPVAMLVEQAGGAATDCTEAILDVVPQGLHQRTPLVFGSAKEVARIAGYHTAPENQADRSPLFGNRGLFRS